MPRLFKTKISKAESKEKKPFKKFEVLLESLYTGLSSPIIVECESEIALKTFVKKQYKHFKKVYFRPFGNKKFTEIINNTSLYLQNG